MKTEKGPSHLEAAVWIFFEEILDVFPASTLESLEKKYGVDTMAYYSYVQESGEFEYVSDEDFDLYYDLQRTYLTGCTCQQNEPLIQRFDEDFNVSRLVSDDGEWLDSDFDHRDAAVSVEIDAMANQLFKLMLHINGLGYIGGKPKSGARFIKGWTAPFSNEWYLAEFYDILASIAKQANKNTAEDGADILWRAFNLGRAYSDRVWREKHFQTSLAGAKQFASLQSATRKMADRSIVRNKYKLRCLKELWHEICKTSPLLSRVDSKAADAIYEYVNANLGDIGLRHLIVKKTGAPIAQDAIRRHLKTLRDKGEI